MSKKSTRNKDRHFLITVSDKQGTRHFKLPKLIKPMLAGLGVSLAIALIGSSLLISSNMNKLALSQAQSESLENAFVKLSSKHSGLNQALEKELGNKVIVSDILAQIEQVSGVNSGPESSIVERLDAISEHVTASELDAKVHYEGLAVLKVADTSIEDNPAIQEQAPVQADLSISQQKILHDSIPSGSPTGDSAITQSFGKRVHPGNQQSSFHNGIDLIAPTGTEVFATADGIIKLAENKKKSGIRIVLAHNLGFETRYTYLSELNVKPGDVVQKGDLIGLTGNFADSDEAYLHYEIRYLGKPHNPVEFINWEFGDQQIFSNVRGIQWQSLISLISKQTSVPTLQLSQLVR